MAYRVSSAQSFTSGNQATTTFVVNSPVGVAAGDIVIIGVASTTNGGLATISCPGFTLGDSIHQATGINQGPHCNMGWLWKVATGSEPSTYTVTGSLAPFTDLECWCAAWTGRNGTTPISANSQTLAAGTNSPVNFALTGVTAAAGDDIIVFTIANQSATCAWTPPTGFTAGLSLQTATPFGNAFFGYKDGVTAGATGALGVIETGIGTDSIGFTIALKQSSGGPAAALAGAASDVTTATAALSTSAAAFAQILLNNGANQITLGSGANTGTGDTLLTAFTKVVQDFTNLNIMLSQLYPSKSLQTPTTGFSITPAAGITQLVLNPTGSLATGTLTMPANPGDQQPFEVMTSQTVTALTHNANSGQTLNGALTTLAANTSAKWIWQASLNTWFRQH
jgi:hypothetical protein